MIRAHCGICSCELHQAPATLLGPPDYVSRVRLHQFCRTCAGRLIALLPVLREHARRDRAANTNCGPRARPRLSLRSAAALVSQARRNTTRSAG